MELILYVSLYKKRPAISGLNILVDVDFLIDYTGIRPNTSAIF